MATEGETAGVEVELGVPVHRMWSAARKVELLIPKLIPDVFTACDVEGDGGPGTVRVYHCGPAIQEGFKIRERIDEFDEATHTISYTVLEGDPRYKSLKATLKYVPSEDGATTTAVFKALFETVENEEGEPDEITEMISLIQTTFVCIFACKPHLRLRCRDNNYTQRSSATEVKLWSRVTSS